MQMDGVGAQPVLRRVAPIGLVMVHALPGLLGEATDEWRGVGADRLHRRERRLQWMRMVIEIDRPAILVVVVERESTLAGQVADAGCGVGLRVRAMADDLVHGPRAR